jgi:hypothetical protein
MGAGIPTGAGGAFAESTYTSTPPVANLGAGGAGGSATTPPEQNVTSTYGAPVSTGNYVWIPNPTSGHVAYINASTLEIKLVNAGDGPTYIAPVFDKVDDVAIVLNVLSSDATLLRASSTGIQATEIPVPSSGNAWAVSADGHWAIAWTDATKVTNPDPLNGYQSISVLDLSANRSTELTVGYRPVAVSFDAAAAHAYTVTQDGINIIDLGSDAGVVKNIPIASTPTSVLTNTNVSITADGSYALVRSDTQPSIAVFSLADASETDIPLPGVATDLQLSADGTTAVAVIRSKGEVALLSIPGSFVAGTTPPLIAVDATIGSVALAPKSTVGLFFTNATPSDVLATLDIAASNPVANTILLRAPILAVYPSDNASYAVVLHDMLGDAGTAFAGAVSLVPVASGLPPEIIGLAAPVISIAMAHAGDYALAAAGDSATGTYQLMVGNMPSLDYQILTLASMPIAAGIVEGAGAGYVAQNYADGRITFVNLSTGTARTITGFELATLVVDGTK